MDGDSKNNKFQPTNELPKIYMDGDSKNNKFQSTNELPKIYIDQYRCNIICFCYMQNGLWEIKWKMGKNKFSSYITKAAFIIQQFW